MKIPITAPKIQTRAIMRRVYYSYILSILVSVSTGQGLLLGVSAVLFVQLVSVENIIRNLLAVELGLVPQYIWQAIWQAILGGEFLTLSTLGVLVFFILSFSWRLPPKVAQLWPKPEVRTV